MKIKGSIHLASCDYFFFRLVREHQKRNKTQKRLGENGSASENQESAARLAHEKSMRRT